MTQRMPNSEEPVNPYTGHRPEGLRWNIPTGLLDVAEDIKFFLLDRLLLCFITTLYRYPATVYILQSTRAIRQLVSLSSLSAMHGFQCCAEWRSLDERFITAGKRMGANGYFPLPELQL